MPKVSCVMCTYGRFTVAERAIAMFLAQTYQDAELVVYHTNHDDPIMMKVPHPRIKIVNCGFDWDTKKNYTSTGQVRKDALKHASGNYYVCYDDDDVYMPWFLQQAVESVRLAAWKPKWSFFRNHGRLELARNTMEASCIVRMDEVRRIGFANHSGKEGLSWYMQLRDRGQLPEDDDYAIPSYCFNWNDPQFAPHKQSGDIDNPNNFENHKRWSTDHPKGRLLDPSKVDLAKEYEPFYAWLAENRAKFDPELYLKYVQNR